MRFAFTSLVKAMRQAGGEVGKLMKPGSGLEALGMYGPDTAFALMTATQGMPQGSSLGERAAAGAVDMIGFGLLPSLVGRAGGKGVGKLLKLGPEGIQGAMNIGEMTAQFTPMLLGAKNPITENAFGREYAKQQEAARLAQEEELRRRQQQAMAGSAIPTLETLAGLGAGRPAAVTDGLLGLYS